MLLLANVFENLRKMCLKIYLDPTKYPVTQQAWHGKTALKRLR